MAQIGPIDPNPFPGGPISTKEDALGFTPPCIVSDLCADVDNYMPVWRWDPAGRQMNECPSPLFIRKDAFTCYKILRKLSKYESPPIIEYDPNAYFTNKCPCNIGFVGINAIQPEEQLHVIGNVKCQDGLFIGDISTKNIYSNEIIDPDGIPNSGDEIPGGIEFKNDAQFGNVGIANLNVANAYSANLTVSYLTAQNTTTDNLTVNNTPTFNKGITIKNSDLKITDASNNVVWNFRPDGKLGVGVATADMKGPYWMWVKNGIMTERVKVAVKGTNDWADDVFDKNYQLKPLEELEKYTKTQKHLPNIPSADEVVKNGYDVQTMDAKLLRKVEELTLYVIELQKEIKSIKKKK